VRLGLVADSHGLADPALPALFAGCDLILHAGDLVRLAVLAPLAAVAPVRAVRGNNDHGPGLETLPALLQVELGGVALLVLHDLGPAAHPHPQARRLLEAGRPQVVVHGHSHRPGAGLHGGILFVNPGSAGPRRFSLPRTAALLDLGPGRARVAHHDLATPGAPLLAPARTFELSRPAAVAGRR
jgi:putative phosphoesterase